MKRRGGVPIMFLLGCLIATAQPYRGGSNYNYFGQNTTPCYEAGYQLQAGPAHQTYNCLANYHVVPNYAASQATIDSQISQLVANGQQRLRLVLFHERGGSQCTSGSLGTIMDSDSTGLGQLSSQCMNNLVNLLTSMHNKGIQEVAISFGPQTGGQATLNNNNPDGAQGGSISCPGFSGLWYACPWPANWWYTQPYEDYYQENWNLIVNVRQQLINAGLKSALNIKFDLKGEAITTTQYQGSLDYARRLWIDYTLNYGNADTFGFSVIPCAAFFSNFDYVYQGNKPDLLDVHLYPSSNSCQSGSTFDGSQQGAYNLYKNTYNALNQAGYGLANYVWGWIIGETYYNSAGTAAGFAQARTELGNTVYWITQWPLNASDASYTNPPAAFVYQQYGF